MLTKGWTPASFEYRAVTSPVPVAEVRYEEAKLNMQRTFGLPARRFHPKDEYSLSNPLVVSWAWPASGRKLGISYEDSSTIIGNLGRVQDKEKPCISGCASNPPRL